MRLPSLLALAATGALLLPISVQAAPSSENSPFMQNCVQQATSQGLAKTAAESHCKCADETIQKNFTKAQIEDLDSRDGVDAKLMQKAQTLVQQQCAGKS
jgi:uncharacterized low-complexity protein